MAQHARIEELSDSDSDPPEMDPSDFDPSGPAIQGQRSTQEQSSALTASLMDPKNIPTQSRGPSQQQQQQQQFADPELYKTWQCLYPVYFDANRTRQEGRRVSREHAVANPLAREIVDAAANLGLRVAFEPGKSHPRDWANPGRVRVRLADASEGGTKTAEVKNKHHLYLLVAAHLRAHPTTQQSPLRLRIQGVPPPKEPLPAPAMPKGRSWKAGTILPLHSPALTGGGVSENFLNDMMAEMQGKGAAGQLPGPAGALAAAAGAGAGGEGAASKKKDKKKGKA